MYFDVIIQHSQTIKDYTLAIAAAIGAYVAVRGLSTWNRQLDGTAKFELTRRILKYTYKLREAIKAVRHPVMLGYEMPLPPDAEAATMSREEIEHYRLAKAYQNRWDKVIEIETDLRAELFEAEAIFGKEVNEKYEILFKLQKELFIVIHIFISSCSPKEDSESRKVHQDILSKKRDILYDKSTFEDDQYSNEVGKAIEDIQLFLKK